MKFTHEISAIKVAHSFLIKLRIQRRVLEVLRIHSTYTQVWMSLARTGGSITLSSGTTLARLCIKQSLIPLLTNNSMCTSLVFQETKWIWATSVTTRSVSIHFTSYGNWPLRISHETLAKTRASVSWSIIHLVYSRQRSLNQRVAEKCALPFL